MIPGGCAGLAERPAQRLACLGDGDGIHREHAFKHGFFAWKRKCPGAVAGIKRGIGKQCGPGAHHHGRNVARMTGFTPARGDGQDLSRGKLLTRFPPGERVAIMRRQQGEIAVAVGVLHDHRRRKITQ